MESDNESPSPPTTPRKKAKVSKVQQKYKHAWECQYDWLTSDPLCEFNAKCKICAITFTISHAGVGQVKQHLTSKKHKAKTEMRKSSGLLQKFFPKTSASTSGLSSPSNEDTKLTAAELAITYHTVKHNLSSNSQDCGVKLNKIIYVDSKTATNI